MATEIDVVQKRQGTPGPGLVILFVALPLEYDAVASRVHDLEEFKDFNRNTLERGLAEGADGAWEVILVETGEGNNKAAAYVAKCIAEFKPDITLFCGIAGGVKDVALGDVVVGETIYFYDRLKEEDEFVRARPTDTCKANETLLQAARQVARTHRRQDPPRYKVFIKPIATGGALVATTKGRVATIIMQEYNDSLAVDTEGSGYMVSALVFEKPALVIRGASDLLADKTTTDKAGWQNTAAGNAAEFTFKLLKGLPLPRRTPADHTSISWDEAVHSLMPLVRKLEAQFVPDIVLTMSGPGSWAAFFSMNLRSRNVPVVAAVTFPLTDEQESAHTNVAEALASGGWSKFRTSKWLIYVPNIIRCIPKSSKILLFDDRVISGESQILLRSWLKEHGFDNVRAAALFASNNSTGSVAPLDFIGRFVGNDFTMPWGPKSGRT